jgi:hypothetical protein
VFSLGARSHVLLRRNGNVPAWLYELRTKPSAAKCRKMSERAAWCRARDDRAGRRGAASIPGGVGARSDDIGVTKGCKRWQSGTTCRRSGERSQVDRGAGAGVLDANRYGANCAAGADRSSGVAGNPFFRWRVSAMPDGSQVDQGAGYEPETRVCQLVPVCRKKRRSDCKRLVKGAKVCHSARERAELLVMISGCRGADRASW